MLVVVDIPRFLVGVVVFVLLRGGILSVFVFIILLVFVCRRASALYIIFGIFCSKKNIRL